MIDAIILLLASSLEVVVVVGGGGSGAGGDVHEKRQRDIIVAAFNQIGTSFGFGCLRLGLDANLVRRLVAIQTARPELSMRPASAVFLLFRSPVAAAAVLFEATAEPE